MTQQTTKAPGARGSGGKLTKENLVAIARDIAPDDTSYDLDALEKHLDAARDRGLDEAQGSGGRRIIQLAVTGVRETISTQCGMMLFALCDDGTVWTTNEKDMWNGAHSWIRVPSVPDCTHEAR